MKHFFPALLQHYKNISFQSKLLLSYGLFILLPVVCITGILLPKSADIIKRQTLSLADVSTERAVQSLEEMLSASRRTISLIAQNESVRTILEKSPDAVPYMEQVTDFNTLNTLIAALNTGSNNQSLRLYVPDGFIFSNQKISLFNLNTLLQTDWYRHNGGSWTGFSFGPLTSQMDITFTWQTFLPVYYPIYSYEEYHKLIGAAQVNFSEDALNQILDQINFSHSGTVYLTDASGQVLIKRLSGPNEESDYLYLEKLPELLGAPEGVWTEYGIGGEGYHAIRKPLNNGAWQICAFVPTESMMKTVTDLSRQVLIFAGLITVSVLALAIWNAGYNGKRISSLGRNMQEVVNGNLDVLSVIDSEDEIGNLQHHFNLMVKTIKSDIKEQYELGQNLKNMELISLQNQINPHFLYNTLDMLCWNAKKNEQNELCAVIGDLALYYRKSLNKGKTFVTIRDEIEHVETYIKIQNYRFENRIRFEKQIDPGLDDKLILKLLLQPLAENAIIHGILEKPDKAGTIVLSVHSLSSGILVSMSDDGVGIAVGQTPDGKIYQNESSHGYGVFNINQRLRLYYGPDCSLKYESTPGKGTRVCFLLPEVRYLDNTE